MMAYIKKHKLLILFALTIFKILAHVYDGYFIAVIFFFFIIFFFTEIVRYTLIIGYLVTTIRSIFKRQFHLGFTVSWIALALLGLIPGGHFQTLGAVLSIYNADPQQFRDDARILMNEYEPMTHFGYFPERPPFDKPISKDKLSSSLLKVHIGDVLVLENYVFIEKYGLSGLFRGFIVFREGSDIWKNEKSITLQNGCNTCWKIRILDGLYWYHAEPFTEDIPTFTVPLQ